MSEPERPETEGRPEAPPAEPVFNLPAVVIWLIAACSAIHVLREHVLTVEQDFELIVRFAFVPLRYSGAYPIDIYALVSPLTYSLLHGGYAHLVINMVWLAAFGTPLANRMGAVRFILFWAATAVAAVALHYVLHSSDAVPLVGASGAISGMMGAAARFAFRIDRRSGRGRFSGPVLPVSLVLRSRAVVTFLSIWMIVNLVTGMGFGDMAGEGGIAWEAHIGGFLAGFLFVAPFIPNRMAVAGPEARPENRS